MKKIISVVLIIIAVAIVAIGGYFIYQYLKQILAPAVNNQQSAADETANWKTYRNEEFGFEFKYPEEVTKLSKQDDEIILTHSIPLFERPDPCDFKGDAPPIKGLTDFKVNIKVVGKNLRDTIIAQESDYFVSNFLPNNELKMEPNFIDEFNIDSLKGYRITSSIEGCGEYKYYFPLNSKNTLFIKRSFITEFQPITPNYKEYLALPGIIPPVEEERLFNNIVSTFKFIEKETQDTSDWKTYNNKECGFEIKYPPTFQIDEIGFTQRVRGLEEYPYQIAFGEGENPRDYILSIMPNQLSPNQWAEQSVLQNKVITPVTFNGIEGVKVSGKYNAGIMDGFSYSFYTVRGDKAYIFNYSYYDNKEDIAKAPLYLKYFDQMISTFKFTK